MAFLHQLTITRHFRSSKLLFICLLFNFKNFVAVVFLSILFYPHGFMPLKINFFLLSSLDSGGNRGNCLCSILRLWPNVTGSSFLLKPLISDYLGMFISLELVRLPRKDSSGFLSGGIVSQVTGVMGNERFSQDHCSLSLSPTVFL